MSQGGAMDAFNYLTVMVSIVLGLGLTQLFAGIGNLVQIRRRVKRFWLHDLWVLLLIVLHLHMWWSFWGLRAVPRWNYGTFVYVLFGPAMLVIASHIIIPELLGERIDVQRHYFDTSPLFFGFLAAAAIWATLLEPVMGLRSFFIPFRLFQGVGISAFVACAASKNRYVHAVTIVLVVLILVSGLTLARAPFRQFELR
jgi:hypothetical protein